KAAHRQPAPGVLRNDSDPDQDSITAGMGWTVLNLEIPPIVTQPQHGVINMQHDGSFTFTTTGGYAGYDHFEYQACDTFAACSRAWVDVYAFPTDDAENAGATCPAVGEPVNPTNGNMWLRQTDYSLPGIGENIEINRFYNSIIQTSGLFGFGWST